MLRESATTSHLCSLAKRRRLHGKGIFASACLALADPTAVDILSTGCDAHARAKIAPI